MRGDGCATRAVALDGAEQKGIPASSSVQLQRGAAWMSSRQIVPGVSDVEMCFCVPDPWRARTNKQLFLSGGGSGRGVTLFLTMNSAVGA